MSKNIPYIARDLRELAVPIESLKTDPKNARKHGTRNHAAIKASLQRFGQRRPLVVRKRGQVVEAGNGTLEAAIALGWQWIAVVVEDDTAAEATAYALADNRTAELAEWDGDNLALNLANLADDHVEIGDLGWSDDELDALLDFGDPEDLDEEEPEVSTASAAPGQRAAREVCCPHCAQTFQLEE